MNSDLLAMLEFLEQEKEIEREELFRIVEEALSISAKKENPEYFEPHVTINRRTGEMTTWATYVVVEEEIGNRRTEVTLAMAKERFPDQEFEVEDEIQWDFETTKSLSRVAAQTTKQAIIQRLRQIEKERVVEEFADLEGELVSGTVRHFEKGEVIVDFGRAEGGIGSKDRVPTEDYQNGDHITLLLKEINITRSGPSLILSRTDANFVKKLFEREVSEIAEGIVEIKAIAREAGYRTKIAVYAEDERIDPVGSCVGMRGSRVRNIVSELNREKVDIIVWKDDIEDLVRECFKPAEILDMDVDYDSQHMKIKANEADYSQIIGKKGQNIRLTNRLTGWTIEVTKDAEPAQNTFLDKITAAKTSLTSLPHVDEIVVEELMANGYLSIDGVSEADPEDLATISGLNAERVADIFEYIANH